MLPWFVMSCLYMTLQISQFSPSSHQQWVCLSLLLKTKKQWILYTWLKIWKEFLLFWNRPLCWGKTIYPSHSFSLRENTMAEKNIIKFCYSSWKIVYPTHHVLMKICVPPHVHKIFLYNNVRQKLCTPMQMVCKGYFSPFQLLHGQHTSLSQRRYVIALLSDTWFQVSKWVIGSSKGFKVKRLKEGSS